MNHLPARSRTTRPPSSVRLLALVALTVVPITACGPFSDAGATGGAQQVRTTGENGWLAFAAEPPGGESAVYLAKEGRSSHRLLSPDGARAALACPAFSPDGTRLAAGQAVETDSGAEDASLVITDVTADGEALDTTTLPLDGLTELPCATWSSDSRWLAFRAGTLAEEHGYLPVASEVWVVDTEEHDVRRLTGLEASDIEWAPDAPDLFIASNGIAIYSTTTGTTRHVDDTSGVVAFALSPDGESIAAEHDANGDVDGPSDLVLMAVDGSDQHTLVDDYDVFHGIGPVWSPDGNKVAFQRLCDTYDDESGSTFDCKEVHEVVVFTVSDEDTAPFGTWVVIEPPSASSTGAGSVWAPYTVSWSPDSTALLYVAWSHTGTGLLAVPVDLTEEPHIYEDRFDVDGRASTWNWAAERD